MSDYPTPTDAEYQILRVLWSAGPSTVREVLEQIDKEGVGYTTVLKLLQIMHEKGLVARDESKRAHVYSPVISEQGAQSQLVNDLLDRVFGGSARKLVLRALDAEEVSEEERQQIRHILANYEEDDDE